MSVISYKCPNCGGELIFDPESQQYQCKYCFSKFHQEQLEAAGSAAFSEAETVEQENEGTAVIYTCPSCGAEIVTEETTAAAFCYYCHNPVILKGRLGGEYLPDLVIPFQIDRKKAEKEFLSYVQSRKFVPHAFFSKDQIEKISGIYFPAWIFDASLHGRMEAVGRNVRVWVSGETEYTETKEYRIEREGEMEFSFLYRNALKKASCQLLNGIWPYQMSEAKEFSMGYLSGFQAERRDLEREELETEVRAAFSEYGEKLLYDSVGHYDSVVTRENHCAVNELHGSYGLLPVWTVTYQAKNGQVYYYTMNGQTGKIAGKLPVDYGKIGILFLSVFFPVLLLCLLGGYFL